jgi:hypothetical protein
MSNFRFRLIKARFALDSSLLLDVDYIYQRSNASPGGDIHSPQEDQIHGQKHRSREVL